MALSNLRTEEIQEKTRSKYFNIVKYMFKYYNCKVTTIRFRGTCRNLPWYYRLVMISRCGLYELCTWRAYPRPSTNKVLRVNFTVPAARHDTTRQILVTSSIATIM